MKDNGQFKPIVLIAVAALFLAFVFDLSKESITDASFVFLVICTLIVIVFFGKNLPGSAVLYAMLSGMFVKLAYVIYTPVWCRQHDVIDFGAGEGHAAYIEYILSHKALPDFDPRSVWAFFQPPLHHTISAVWMWLGIRFRLPEKQIYKNVQILPLVYMFLLTFTVYLICSELKMRSGGKAVAMLIASFHPIYILMSGSINNDALSVMLTVVALYVAIRWYLYPTTGKIIALALSIGLAMSAKLSAALIAPPVAIMMIYKIVRDTGKFKDRKKLISYILELIPFAIVVFPLGLWWSIRNKILFDMPINYIPEVGEHIEGAGLFSRILDVRTASPFLYMKSNGFAYDEYNLIVATIKSSLFGEGDFANISPILTATGWILLVLAVVICILQIVGTIRTCTVKEAGPDNGIKILLAGTVVTFVAGYVAFALKGANLSAMDPRYCAAIVGVLSVFCGLWYDRLEAVGKKALCRIIMTLSMAFATVSTVFYILVGIL